jgi:predicted ATPase
MTRALTTDSFRVGVVQQSMLAAFLDTDAAREPLCIVFEDLQYADYQSLEMVLFLAESLGEAVLLVCTGRSDFFAQRERWSEFGAPRHDFVELPWLSLAQADTLIVDLLAGCEGGAPTQLRSLIAEYGHGNPYLIRQAARSLFECGALVHDSGAAVWRFNLDRLDEFRMRADRRVDRLANLSLTEQRVLEHAAMIGDSFWIGALIALARAESAGHTENDPFQSVALAVHALQQRGVIRECEESSLPEERQFSFAHDAERKQMLTNVSSERRRQYHRTIGGFLHDAFQERQNTDISAPRWAAFRGLRQRRACGRRLSVCCGDRAQPIRTGARSDAVRLGSQAADRRRRRAPLASTARPR